MNLYQSQSQREYGVSLCKIALMIFCYLDLNITIYVIIGCMFFYTLAYGFINPSGTALALKNFTESAGTASGVIVSLKMLVAAIVLLILGSFGSSQPIIFAITILIIGVLSNLISLASRIAYKQGA